MQTSVQLVGDGLGVGETDGEGDGVGVGEGLGEAPRVAPKLNKEVVDEPSVMIQSAWIVESSILVSNSR